MQTHRPKDADENGQCECYGFGNGGDIQVIEENIIIVSVAEKSDFRNIGSGKIVSSAI